MAQGTVENLVISSPFVEPTRRLSGPWDSDHLIRAKFLARDGEPVERVPR